MNETKNGTTVASLSVATNRPVKDRDGNYQDETEWHRVKVFGKSAEYCGKYIHKGSMVYVVGRLETRKYNHTDGTERYSTDIIAEAIRDLSRREGKSHGQEGNKNTTTGNDVPF